MIINKQEIISEFASKAGDVGSSKVQIAILTKKIEILTKHVQKFKKEIFDSTLLVITHRTSLLSLVDKVIIMENGKVAGMGTTEQFSRAQSDKNAASEIVKNATAAQFGVAPKTNTKVAENIDFLKKNSQTG